MKRPAQEPPASSFDVVALVASAGGHAAIGGVLRLLPAQFPVPIILMQHLGHESKTAAVYQRLLPFGVKWVRTDAKLAPGQVLVCPPRSFVEVMPDGSCAVSPCQGASDHPIDAFLESLARSFGARAIGLVLTGMGSDGALGARELHLAGGCVVVQSEASAEFPSMPRAAIEAGAADVVLPLDKIGPTIVDLVAGEPLPRAPSELEAVAALFAGEGAADTDLRAVDWSATQLGPVLGWPQPLQTTVRNIMSSSFPSCIYWGSDAVQIYNEAFLPLFGAKPTPAGKPARLTWPELWSNMGPQFESVRRTGKALFAEDQLFQPDRHGFPEEVYLTYSYSPLHEADGSVQGVLATATDTTARVRAGRRLKVLRDLAAMEPGESAVRVLENSAKVLLDAPLDVPFGLLYLFDKARIRANLGAAVGLAAGSAAAPHTIKLRDSQTVWPLADLVASGTALTVGDLPNRLSGVHCGPWPESPLEARLLPLRIGTEGPLAGVAVLGLSPRLRFDPAYGDFLDVIAQHLSTALGDAEARQQARERSERLAELDRAKMEFFSNVSHEFRTPLTLLLAPLEELLRRRETLPAGLEPEVDAAVRNGQRLLNLVNNLLDFSQGEARRERAKFEPTDLCAVTSDIVSAFRSAIEGAGLHLRTACDPSMPPVWTDREMWEKIVSNLLSNAFKFAFEGEIRVLLKALSMHAELVVKDTGIGIPQHELPHLFKRFHRVRGARARTLEGSGIGLAIVRDLVARLGGQLRVRSKEHAGTTFTIWLPYKSARLAAEPGAVAEAPGPSAFALEQAREASRWLGNSGAGEAPNGVMADILGPPPVLAEPAAAPLGGPAPAGGRRARILVADDNTDMRDYLRRLFSPEWEVETVADGQAAMEAAARQCPDAILADVMMPGLDGFELLKRVRGDARLSPTPVILVTARAGEEAAIEGLLAGADDYIAKPFSPRELVARVRTSMERSRAQALRERELRLTAEADALARLNEASSRLWRATGLTEGLEVMLHATVDLLGADMGNIQILEDGVLRIAAQRGFREDFLDFFREVSIEDDCACGRALRGGEPLVLEDVETDPHYAPLRAVARRAGYRAVVSVPIIGRDGAPLGMVSSHFREPHRPSEQELRRLDLFARQAADFIERRRIEAALQARNDELERFSKIAVGRELRMIELKEEINALRGRLGEAVRYATDFPEIEVDDHV